jgi:hypothetical protein
MSDGEPVHSESDEAQAIGSGLQGQVKPWTLPVQETPFKVKNQIFYSPKPSAEKMK